MEIILSKQCESLTGSLGRGFGYHIQRRKNGFFAKRNSHGEIPRDGHLRFILSESWSRNAWRLCLYRAGQISQDLLRCRYYEL